MDGYDQSQSWQSNRRVAGSDKAKSRSGNEYGFVTLLILVLFATLSAYGFETFIKGHLENEMVRHEIYARQAVYASEGGIEWAKARLNQDPLFSGGEIMIGDSRVQVQIVALDQGYEVTAGTQNGQANRTLQVHLERKLDQWVMLSYKEIRP